MMRTVYGGLNVSVARELIKDAFFSFAWLTLWTAK